MKTIDIICPLYNAEDYIKDFHNSLLMQENVLINKIIYILTESKDNTEEYLKENHIEYQKICKDDFSHSLIREKAGLASKADIIVFVTQDVKIERRDWLYHLTKDINDIDTVACYSRQVTRYNNIEKYTREANYPEKSFIVSLKDVNNLGLKTFFFSDASSAISRSIFEKLKAYDAKDLPTNEDMYIAYKIIMGGYSIKYCADSEVVHSHDFTLKEIYDRYRLIGMFFNENKYLDQYGTIGSGKSLAVYILKRIFEERRYALFFRFPFDMAARFMGMKAGMK